MTSALITSYMSSTGFPVHEFFLGDSTYVGSSPFGPLYRVALGDLMDSTQRQTFPSEYGHSKTGTIGFMDVRRNTKYIPLAINEDYPNELTREVLCVEQVGIEPQFRRQGHAAFLVRRAEELAREWELDIVYMTMIQGDPRNGIMPDLIQDMLQRAGYRRIDNGFNAYKKLE